LRRLATDRIDTTAYRFSLTKRRSPPSSFAKMVRHVSSVSGRGIRSAEHPSPWRPA